MGLTNILAPPLSASVSLVGRVDMPAPDLPAAPAAGAVVSPEEVVDALLTIRARREVQGMYYVARSGSWGQLGPAGGCCPSNRRLACRQGLPSRLLPFLAQAATPQRPSGSAARTSFAVITSFQQVGVLPHGAAWAHGGKLSCQGALQEQTW